MEVPAVAEALFALPPSRFVSERDALATTLASRGDPAAAAVRRLRRPVGLAWLLNRLARERPDEVQALVASGDRLRAGQRRALAGAGAGELRAAEQDLRERVRALRSEGGRILASERKREDPATLARLELLLRVLAPAPGPARDAFRRGVLHREPEIAGELAGLTILPGGRAGAPAAPRAAGAGSAPVRAGGAGPRLDRRRDERERAARRARQLEISRLRRAVAAALARAARAERRAAAADERAARERALAAKEREEAEQARRRLEDADRAP